MGTSESQNRLPGLSGNAPEGARSPKRRPKPDRASQRTCGWVSARLESGSRHERSPRQRALSMPTPECRNHAKAIARGSRATAAELDLGSAGGASALLQKEERRASQSCAVGRLLLVRSESPRGAAGDACLRPTAGAVSVPLEDRRPGRRLEPRGGSVRTSACLPIGAMELWRVRAASSTPSSRS
jgi:hypothetical protein